MVSISTLNPPVPLLKALPASKGVTLPPRASALSLETHIYEVLLPKRVIRRYPSCIETRSLESPVIRLPTNVPTLLRTPPVNLLLRHRRRRRRNVTLASSSNNCLASDRASFILPLPGPPLKQLKP